MKKDTQTRSHELNQLFRSYHNQISYWFSVCLFSFKYLGYAVFIEKYFSLQVDRSVTDLKYMDPICDVLYHIKYMFTGDSIKNDLEGIIRGLRPALQRRLRFITHLNLDSIEVIMWLYTCLLYSCTLFVNLLVAAHGRARRNVSC